MSSQLMRLIWTLLFATQTFACLDDSDIDESEVSANASSFTNFIANVGFEGNFVDSADGNRVVFVGAVEPTISSAHAREGTRSMKCVVARLSPLSANTTGTTHCEINTGAGPRIGNDEFWMGFSIYVPAGFSDPNGQILKQIHKAAGPGDTEFNPPITLNLHNGVWRFTVSWNTENPVRDGATKRESYSLGQAATGRWTDFVIHGRLRHTDKGFLYVYVNGELRMKRPNAPNWYNEYTKPPLDKYGTYKPIYKYVVGQDSPASVTFWHDAIRVGGADGGYYAVAPRGSRLDAR